MFWFTGVIGGFTTFSAFSLETFLLLRQGSYAMALGNALLSVLCGIAAVWLGFKLSGFGFFYR
jgi:CrcB protein